MLVRPSRPLDYPISRGKNKDCKYINMVSKIATAVEPVANARIAAVMVFRNEVVSVGICRKKSHPFQAIYGKNKDSIFLHAETDCIKNAIRNLTLEEISKSSLYICRVKYESQEKGKFVFGLAKPCSGCERAIANFDIKKVIYSLNNEGYNML